MTWPAPTHELCARNDAAGHHCLIPPTRRYQRVDGSTFVMCTHHANMLERQIAKHPIAYEPLQVVPL